MKAKCCHRTIWLQLREEWWKFWSHFSLAENDHVFLGPFGTVNSLELCNIILTHQELNSDKADKKWQGEKTSLFMVIYVICMKWRKGEDSKKNIEATSQSKQSISQHNWKIKQGNTKKYIEVTRENSLSSTYIVQHSATRGTTALR